MHRASARTAAVVVAVLLVLLAGAGMLALSLPRAGTAATAAALGVLLVAAGAGGSPFTTAVLRLADRAQRHSLDVDASPLSGHPALHRAALPAESVSAPGLLRGGATLGVLERLATFASLAAGFPEGVAVVVAVKGLGRFSELKVAAAGERFMIGSLASLLWAGGCWAVATAVLH